jgi:hypothetical protein
MDAKSNEKTIKAGRLKVLHVIDLAQHRTGHSNRKINAMFAPLSLIFVRSVMLVDKEL